jgi:hypothetical protein
VRSVCVRWCGEFVVLRGFAKFCKVLRGFARFCEVMPGFARFWAVLGGFVKGVGLRAFVRFCEVLRFCEFCDVSDFLRC